ncbi:unnamed protein product [Leptosia nina]|uniref:Uncharacterized protein n=1 Tax=Leptosia nina TaxID=320188 RepID=A0AAV1K0Y8_9NEOP
MLKKIVRESDRQLRGEDRSLGIEIIDSFNREGRYQLCLFFFLAYSTIMGFGLGAEKGQLPLRAWYPYDEMKTPAYQITYVHQVAALSIAACVNISIDNLVTSLVALCSCRLQLLALSLRTLMDGFYEDKTGLISYGDEEMVLSRLRMYVVEHQAVLESAAMIQACFSVPILAQFTVSMFIICVTAYQLAFSEAVSRASYECPWYKCRARVSKALLTVMCRSQRAVRLTAAGMADLSLATFMAIIKASYTFFTVLQRVGDGNN